jgi:hypothetical protein
LNGVFGSWSIALNLWLQQPSCCTVLVPPSQVILVHILGTATLVLVCSSVVFVYVYIHCYTCLSTFILFPISILYSFRVELNQVSQSKVVLSLRNKPKHPTSCDSDLHTLVVFIIHPFPSLFPSRLALSIYFTPPQPPPSEPHS